MENQDGHYNVSGGSSFYQKWKGKAMCSMEKIFGTFFSRTSMSISNQEVKERKVKKKYFLRYKIIL